MCLTLLSTLMLMTRDSKGKKSVTTDLLILTYGSSSKPSRESLICNRLRKDRKQNCNNNMPKYIIWTTVRTWSIAWPMFRCTCTVWHQNKILLALELNRCGHTEKQYRIVSILLVFDFCKSQNKPNTRAYMGWCKRGEWSGLPQPRARTHTKIIPRKKIWIHIWTTWIPASKIWQQTRTLYTMNCTDKDFIFQRFRFIFPLRN